ncbi:hypothetical protein HYW74_02185 [Candidatus Pacearchaeota archaeon]|nr:hypothetical protein [Candidatus Pacearchaeota archaeon]
MVKYNEGDIILCEVKDVVKTTVFVETLDGMKGSIVFSEVAPGRIRNIRDYVVPKKIVACKILHIAYDHLFLSLRRVKDKEKKEALEIYKKERSLESFIKKLLGNKAGEIISKIRSENSLSLVEFFESAKQNSKLSEKYFSKSEIEKLTSILTEKKEKEKEIKKEFILSCNQPDGIIRIKKMLSPHDSITYLGSSKFMIKAKSIDLKQADSKLNKILETIEKESKKEKCEFAMKK